MAEKHTATKEFKLPDPVIVEEEEREGKSITELLGFVAAASADSNDGDSGAIAAALYLKEHFGSTQYYFPEYDFPLYSWPPFVFTNMGKQLKDHDVAHSFSLNYVPFRVAVNYFQKQNVSELTALQNMVDYQLETHAGGSYTYADKKIFLPEPGTPKAELPLVLADLEEGLSNYYFTVGEFMKLHNLYLGETHEGLDLTLNGFEVMNRVKIEFEGRRKGVYRNGKPLKDLDVLFVPKIDAAKSKQYYAVEREVASYADAKEDRKEALHKRKKKHKLQLELERSMASYKNNFIALETKHKEFQITNLIFFSGQVYPHYDKNDFLDEQLMVDANAWIEQAIITYLDSTVFFSQTLKKGGAAAIQKRIIAAAEKQLLTRVAFKSTLQRIAMMPKGHPLVNLGWYVLVDTLLSSLVKYAWPDLFDEDRLKSMKTDAEIAGLHKDISNVLRTGYLGQSMVTPQLEGEFSIVKDQVDSLNVEELKQLTTYYKLQSNALEHAAQQINPESDYSLAEKMLKKWLVTRKNKVDKKIYAKVSGKVEKLAKITSLTKAKDRYFVAVDYELDNADPYEQDVTGDRVKYREWDKRLQAKLTLLYNSATFDKDVESIEEELGVLHADLSDNERQWIRKEKAPNVNDNPLAFIDSLLGSLAALGVKGLNDAVLVKQLYDVPEGHVPFVDRPHFGFSKHEKTEQLVSWRYGQRFHEGLKSGRGVDLSYEDVELLWSNDLLSNGKWQSTIRAEDWFGVHNYITRNLDVQHGNRTKNSIDFDSKVAAGFKGEVKLTIDLKELAIGTLRDFGGDYKDWRMPHMILTNQKMAIRAEEGAVSRSTPIDIVKDEQKDKTEKDVVAPKEPRPDTYFLPDSHLPYVIIDKVSAAEEKQQNKVIAKKYFKGVDKKFQKFQKQKLAVSAKSGKRIVQLPRIKMDDGSKLNSGYFFTWKELKALLPHYAANVRKVKGKRLDFNIEHILAYNDLAYTFNGVEDANSVLSIDPKKKLYIPYYVSIYNTEQLTEEGLEDLETLKKDMENLRIRHVDETNIHMQRQALLSEMEQFIARHEQFMFNQMLVTKNNLTNFFFYTRKNPLSIEGFEATKRQFIESNWKLIFKQLEQMRPVAHQFTNQVIYSGVDATFIYDSVKNKVGDAIDKVTERKILFSYRNRKGRLKRTWIKRNIMPAPFDNLGFFYKVFVDKQLGNITSGIADRLIGKQSDEELENLSKQQYFDYLNGYINLEVGSTREDASNLRQIWMKDLEELSTDLNSHEIKQYQEQYRKMNRFLDARIHEIDFNNLGYSSALFDAWLAENAVTPEQTKEHNGYATDPDKFQTILEQIRNQDIRNYLYSRANNPSLAPDQREGYWNLMKALDDASLDRILGNWFFRDLKIAQLKMLDPGFDETKIAALQVYDAGDKAGFTNRPLFWLSQVSLLMHKMGIKDVKAGQLVQPYTAKTSKETYTAENKIDDVQVTASPKQTYSNVFIPRDIEGEIASNLEKAGVGLTLPKSSNPSEAAERVIELDFSNRDYALKFDPDEMPHTPAEGKKLERKNRREKRQGLDWNDVTGPIRVEDIDILSMQSFIQERADKIEFSGDADKEQHKERLLSSEWWSTVGATDDFEFKLKVTPGTIKLFEHAGQKVTMVDNVDVELVIKHVSSGAYAKLKFREEMTPK